MHYRTFSDSLGPETGPNEKHAQSTGRKKTKIDSESYEHDDNLYQNTFGAPAAYASAEIQALGEEVRSLKMALSHQQLQVCCLKKKAVVTKNTIRRLVQGQVSSRMVAAAHNDESTAELLGSLEQRIVKRNEITKARHRQKLRDYQILISEQQKRIDELLQIQQDQTEGRST